MIPVNHGNRVIERGCVSRRAGTVPLRGRGGVLMPLAVNWERLASAKRALARQRTRSPAVHNGQLLLRSDRYLYCIGRQVDTSLPPTATCD